MMSLKRRLGLVALTMVCGSAFAGGGPLGIDHEWSLDESGIWARKYQSALAHGVILAGVGTALWLSNDDPLGHTAWQTVDSMLISAVGVEALKYAFARARPDQGGDPNKWFQGRCCQSFPSGEVALQGSFVAPIIVNYGQEYPWVWALQALPLYDSIARMKSQDHWQTDVIAGWALGSAVGYWATTFKTSLTVRILPRGLTVGLQKPLWRS